VNEIVSVLAGGSALAALLTLFVRATLAMLRSQGEQMREWQQIVDQKDQQIARLEERLKDRDQRIGHLETRVAELEREVRGRD
jgi:septal ring factor EnvC (AmiA/AmiB activator)